MKRMQFSVGVFGLAMTAMVSTGCGTGVDSGGTASLRFANGSSLAAAANFHRILPEAPIGALATYAPTTFQMKLIAAYITEDIDPGTGSNVGQTSMIYLNPDCAEDIMHCDISAGTAEDGAPMDKIVTSYFDFAQSSADVNAALNAQGRSITMATYRYARLEFCKYNTGNAENIKWGGTFGLNTVTDREFKRNSCTVNSAEFTTPIDVAEGDTVTITLSYSLAGLVSDAAGGDDTASGAPGGTYYFTMPTFVPSAAKE